MIILKTLLPLFLYSVVACTSQEPPIVNSTSEDNFNSETKRELAGIVAIHRHGVRTPRNLVPGKNVISSGSAHLLLEGEKQMRQLGTWLWQKYFNPSSNDLSVTESTTSPTQSADTVAPLYKKGKNVFAAFSAHSIRCIESSQSMWHGFSTAALNAGHRVESVPLAESVSREAYDYLYQLSVWPNIALHLANPKIRAEIFSVDGFTRNAGNSDIIDLLMKNITAIAQEAHCGTEYSVYLCLLVAYDVADIARTRNSCTINLLKTEGNAAAQPVDSTHLETNRDTTTVPIASNATSTNAVDALEEATLHALCDDDIFAALREVTAYQNYNFYAYFSPKEFQSKYTGSYTRLLFHHLLNEVDKASAKRIESPDSKKGKFLIEYSVHDGTLVGLYTMFGLLQEQTSGAAFQSSSYEIPQFGETLVIEFYTNSDVVLYKAKANGKEQQYTYHAEKHLQLPYRCFDHARSHKMINVTVTKSSNSGSHCSRHGLESYVRHHWTPSVQAGVGQDTLSQVCHVDPQDLHTNKCETDATGDSPIKGSACSLFRTECASKACDGPKYVLNNTTLQCVENPKDAANHNVESIVRHESKPILKKIKGKADDILTHLPIINSNKNHYVHRLVVVMAFIGIMIVVVCGVYYSRRRKRRSPSIEEINLHGKNTQDRNSAQPPLTYSTF